VKQGGLHSFMHVTQGGAYFFFKGFFLGASTLVLTMLL